MKVIRKRQKRIYTLLLKVVVVDISIAALFPLLPSVLGKA